MKEITVQELKQMMDEKKDFQLIDVREEYEFEIANLGGELISMGNILQAADKISKTKPVIIHCRTGARRYGSSAIGKDTRLYKPC